MIRAPFSVFAACLFALGLPFAAVPARAQGGPGHWKLTVIPDGIWSKSRQDLTTGVTNSNQGALTADYCLLREDYGSQERLIITASGTYTFRLDWLDDAGLPALNPPPYTSLLLFSDAFWSVGAGSITSHGAADGLGDPEIDGASRGQKLVMLHTASGFAQTQLSLSANVDFVGTGSSLCYVALYPSGSIDTRFATIHSTLDPTFHREEQAGVAVRVPNDAQDGSGDVHADTVKISGFDAMAVQYKAYITGDWAPGSSYHWYEDAYGYADAGAFSLPDNDFPFDFTRGGLSYNFQTTKERVDLHLTDANDGIETHSEYYLKFHNKYEDWKRPRTDVLPPAYDPAKGPAGNPEWQTIADVNNPTPDPVTKKLTQSYTVENSITGELGSEQSFDIKLVTFKVNEKITLDQKVTATYTNETGWTVRPYTHFYFRIAPAHEERYGTCGLYDPHGYFGDGTGTRRSGKAITKNSRK